MTLEQEYQQLIMKRNNLLKEKQINEEKIRKLNQLIDYYTWAFNSYLFQENCYYESISSYKNILNKPKHLGLLDFSFFDASFNKYYLNKIESLEKKIKEINKSKSSIKNLLTIKNIERKNLIDKNKKIDFYIEQTKENINDKKIIKSNFDKQF